MRSRPALLQLKLHMQGSTGLMQMVGPKLMAEDSANNFSQNSGSEENSPPASASSTPTGAEAQGLEGPFHRVHQVLGRTAVEPAAFAFEPARNRIQCFRAFRSCACNCSRRQRRLVQRHGVRAAAASELRRSDVIAASQACRRTRR